MNIPELIEYLITLDNKEKIIEVLAAFKKNVNE